jgi:hypothetical protein
MLMRLYRFSAARNAAAAGRFQAEDQQEKQAAGFGQDLVFRQQLPRL